MSTGKKVRNSDEKLKNKNKAQKNLYPEILETKKSIKKISPVHQYTR